MSEIKQDNMGGMDASPHSYSGTEALDMLAALYKAMRQMGLDPLRRDDWQQGIFGLLGVQTINMPDLDSESFVIAANHVSDFDAAMLGLLHPNMRIISKIGWTQNKELMDALGRYYDIVGIYRESEIEALEGDAKKAAKEHNYKTTVDALKFLKGADNTDNTGSTRHLLIFPQGTISDINRNTIHRINPGFAKLANMAKRRILNIFQEYPAMGGGTTRIIAGTPYAITDRNADCRQPWLDDMIALQNSLGNVRPPVLSEKHARNNSPDEPFF